MTSCFPQELRTLHTKFQGVAELHDLGHCVSPLMPETINGYRSFLVQPDGSKIGWEVSKEGEAMREEMIVLLKEALFEDGSPLCDWVLVQYGDDERETKILDDSDVLRRRK